MEEELLLDLILDNLYMNISEVRHSQPAQYLEVIVLKVSHTGIFNIHFIHNRVAHFHFFVA